MKMIELDVKGTNLSLQVIEQPDKEFTQWIPITPICEAIGVMSDKQSKRIQKDKKFTTRQLAARGSDGKQRTFVCIPAEQVAGFLYTINTRLSQKPEVAERLLNFQKYLQKAMNQVVFGDLTMEVVAELRSSLLDLKAMYLDLAAKHNALEEAYITDVGDIASFGAKKMARKRHLKLIN
jgi:hypothetical protein